MTNRALYVVTAALLQAMPITAQDTLRIRADNAPVWGPAVTLTKVLAIGSLDGPDEYAFGAIDAFAVRDDGTFFIYDGQDVRVRMYDPNGKFMRNVGRSGSGPGEYQRVVAIALIGDTALATWDANLRRISFFDRSGVFRSSLATTDGMSTPDAFGVDAAGRLYVKTQGCREAPPGEDGLCYARMSPTGKTLDSVSVPDRNAARGFVVELTPEGYRWNFMPTTVTALYPPGGVVSGRTDRYAVTMPVSGKPAVVERTHTPVPMRAEERAEWSAAVREWDAAMVKGGRPAPDRQPIPNVKPPFRGLAADRDGRVWVEIYTTATKRILDPLPATATLRAEITWRESTTFDVLGADGRYLGRVALPQNSVLLAARGNRIWVKTTGASGELAVLVYRLNIQ